MLATTGWRLAASDRWRTAQVSLATMKRPWLTVLLIVSLVATNLVTAGLLVKAYSWDQMWLRFELQTQATSHGGMWAMNDFRAGKFRQLRLVSAAVGRIEDTGRRDGPFEIWTWTYVDGAPGSREAAEAFVAMYNGKMRHMYENPDAFLEGVANHPLQFTSDARD